MTEKLWNLDVVVMPKQGVNDPQGDAVRGGLQSLGFSETGRVRVGKRITLELTAADEQSALAIGTDMCSKLLANPVIEEFELKVTAAEVQQ